MGHFNDCQPTRDWMMRYEFVDQLGRTPGGSHTQCCSKVIRTAFRKKRTAFWENNGHFGPVNLTVYPT